MAAYYRTERGRLERAQLRLEERDQYNLRIKNVKNAGAVIGNFLGAVGSSLGAVGSSFGNFLAAMFDTVIRILTWLGFGKWLGECGPKNDSGGGSDGSDGSDGPVGWVAWCVEWWAGGESKDEPGKSKEGKLPVVELLVAASGVVAFIIWFFK